MNHKHIFKVSFLVSVFVIGFTMIQQHVISQDKVMTPPSKNYYSISPKTGDVTHPQFSETPMTKVEVSPKMQDLERKIDAARLNNDVTSKEQYENELNQLQGATRITPGMSNQAGLAPIIINMNYKKNNQGNNDYNVNPVNNGSDPWSVATCTNPTGFPNAGRIWCAYTGFSSTATDTFHLAYSDNGGATWTLYTTFNFGSNNYKFRSSELEIIPVYDGTNAYIFGVANINAPSNPYTVWFRYNITGNTGVAYYMIPAGQGFTYSTRIATDNSIYSSNSYVFTISSFDSSYVSGGSTYHYIGQKFCDVQNPFAATPTFTFLNPGGQAGFYWAGGGFAAGVYFSSDISYYADQGGTGNNRIMVLLNVNNGGGYGDYSMYLSWLDNYAGTVTALALTETAATRNGRFAFNGGTANRNGMIIYLRDFSGADWDLACQNTTTGGTTTGAWTMGYVDFTGYHAGGYPTINAFRGGANTFRVAYCSDSASTSAGGRGMYAGWNGSSWSSPSRLDVTGAGVDSTYACIDAGFKLGGGDDGLSVYSKTGGTGALGIFSSNNYLTTTGIQVNNNEIPRTYALEQNYPNPFNPTTDIKFSIPNTGLVKLVLYDILGREVRTMLNETKQAGNYTISFDASTLSSGVYFYKLTSGNFTDVKKMSLVK